MEATGFEPVLNTSIYKAVGIEPTSLIHLLAIADTLCVYQFRHTSVILIWQILYKNFNIKNFLIKIFVLSLSHY